MSASKVVIIVLVVAAVLFAVGLGGGLVRSDGPPSDPSESPTVGALGSVLARKQSLSESEVKSATFRNRMFTFPPGGRCEAEIAPGEARTRSFVLKITTADRSDVRVIWKPHHDPDRPSWQPDDALDVTATLKRASGPRELKLQAPTKGGKLTLELLSPVEFTGVHVRLE